VYDANLWNNRSMLNSVLVHVPYFDFWDADSWLQWTGFRLKKIKSDNDKNNNFYEPSCSLYQQWIKTYKVRCTRCRSEVLKCVNQNCWLKEKDLPQCYTDECRAQCYIFRFFEYFRISFIRNLCRSFKWSAS